MRSRSLAGALGMIFTILCGVMIIGGFDESPYEVRWVFIIYLAAGTVVWVYSLVVLVVLLLRHHSNRIQNRIPFYDSWLGDFFILFRILWSIPHFITLRYQVDSKHT
jgi:amino acid transporter